MLLCHKWQRKSYCLTSQLISGSEQSILQRTNVVTFFQFLSWQAGGVILLPLTADCMSGDGELMTGVGPSSWLIVSLVKMWRRTIRGDRGGRNVTWGCWLSVSPIEKLVRDLSCLASSSLETLEDIAREKYVFFIIKKFFCHMWGKKFEELMQILGSQCNMYVTFRYYCNNRYVALEWPDVESKFCFYRVSTWMNSPTQRLLLALNMVGHGEGEHWDWEPTNTNVTHLIRS